MTFTAKDILQMQVAPALGCTEPVAIALGAAAAASLLPKSRAIGSIEIWLDPNIYKNGMGVIIPGTRGMIGLDTAAVLGALGGDPTLGLEVLEPLTDEIVERARDFLRDKGAVVHLREQSGLHIQTLITADGYRAESLITHLHNNIVELKLNGTAADSPLLAKKLDGKTGNRHQELEEWLKRQNLETLVGLTDDFDEEDLAFILEGINCNLKLAAYGLKHGTGLGVGKALERMLRQKMLVKDMTTTAKILTSAAADARMGGVKLPAMSSAGSGNHGLTATLPIWAIKDYIEHEEETVLRAVGLSHIITAYVKAHTGRLSAVCGCSVAAGAGAAAGIVYLIGGDASHMEGAIKNIAEDLTGIICDGAKSGCAIKLNTAAGAAVQAALFALQGVNVKETDGIIGEDLEKTIRNVGMLSIDGMVETDRTILKIMREKQGQRAKKEN